MTRIGELPERKMSAQIRDTVVDQDGREGTVKGIFLDDREGVWMIRTENGVAKEENLTKVNE